MNSYLTNFFFVNKYRKLIIVISIFTIYLFIIFFSTEVLKDFYLQEIKSDLLIQSEAIKKKIKPILFNQKNENKENENILSKIITNLSLRSHTQIELYRCNNQIGCENYPNIDDININDKNILLISEIRKAGNSTEHSFYFEIIKDIVIDKNIKTLHLLIPLKDNNKSIVFVLKISQIIVGFHSYWPTILIFICLLPILLLLLILLLIAKKIDSDFRDIKKLKQISEFSNNIKENDNNNSSIYKTTVSLNQLVNNLLKQKQQLDSFFSSMNEGVLAIDNNDNILYINRAVTKLLELSDKEYIGNFVYEIAGLSICYQFITDIKIAKDHIVREVTIKSNSQSISSLSQSLYQNEISKVFQLSGVPLYDHIGDRIGILIIVSDVSKAKEIEKKHQEFVSNVAHELKTPITSIKGFIDTIFDQDVTDKDEIFRYLQIVRRQTERLIAIIEDLLTLSLLQHKRTELEFKIVPLIEMIEESVEICRLKSNTKKININVICNKDIVLKVNLPLFEQALVNLIENSIKYSNDHSKIDIVVNDCDDLSQAKENEIVIAVRDEGIGIPLNDLEHIFERFYRVDKTRSRKSGGTGLGLAIVKHITDIHNGRSWVKSTKGKGSVFYISVPGNLINVQNKAPIV
ncbi:MAG: ATP-binding protein [Oligoflexia bacterium]|nr:ATP-binding protein [Oligoflexia bacterium]